jgi:hypothetical protein
VSTQFNCRTSCLSFLDDLAGPSTDANPPSLQETIAADKVDSPLPAAEPLPPPPLEAQQIELEEPPPPKTLLTEILSELGQDDDDELTHETSEQKSESCSNSNSIFSPRSSHTHTHQLPNSSNIDSYLSCLPACHALTFLHKIGTHNKLVHSQNIFFIISTTAPIFRFNHTLSLPNH